MQAMNSELYGSVEVVRLPPSLAQVLHGAYMLLNAL